MQEGKKEKEIIRNKLSPFYAMFTKVLNPDLTHGILVMNQFSNLVSYNPQFQSTNGCGLELSQSRLNQIDGWLHSRRIGPKAD